MNQKISKNDQGLYRTQRPVTGDELIGFAQNLVAEDFSRLTTLSSPQETRRFLTMQLCREEREVFMVVFVDSQNRVQAAEPMFLGTIDAASVHPREVVKRCLQLNAAAVILAHNHPSGHPEPSQADRSITDKLTEALSLVDIRVLDHFVIGGTESVSFAERGWI